jgi:hypothetical protein
MKKEMASKKPNLQERGKSTRDVSGLCRLSQQNKQHATAAVQKQQQKQQQKQKQQKQTQ